MAYLPDDNGNMICDDCWHHCTGEPCPQIHCRCACHPEPPPPAGSLMKLAGRMAGGGWQRALELDDRPAVALANLAADIEAEARPDLQQLLDERFQWPALRRERHRRAA
jgi:hypothetical protein